MDDIPTITAATKDMLRYLSKIGPARREEFFGVFRDVLDQPSNTPMVVGQQSQKQGRNRVTKSRSVRRSPAAPGAAKRPLNSFIAFRGYYMPMFGETQQKDISGFLTQLWQADLFQAKWTVIARAYSDIRDQVGKVKAPLNAFLQLLCPEVGIMPPHTYLNDMGWVFFNGQLLRDHIPNRSEFPQEIQSSTLTVSDCVDFACRQGYFTPVNQKPAAPVSSLMMLSQPPKSVGSDNVAFLSGQTFSTPSDASDAVESCTTLSSSMFPKHDSPDPTMFDAQPLIEPDLLLAHSGDEYPFSVQFDPDDSNGLFFDPHAVEPYASYDMNLFFRPEAFLDPSLFGAQSPFPTTDFNASKEFDQGNLTPPIWKEDHLFGDSLSKT